MESFLTKFTTPSGYLLGACRKPGLAGEPAGDWRLAHRQSSSYSLLIHTRLNHISNINSSQILAVPYGSGSLCIYTAPNFNKLPKCHFSVK